MADLNKTRITTIATTVVKTTPGQFYGLVAGALGVNGVIEVYDAASVTGTPILMLTSPGTLTNNQSNMALPHPIRMSVGITVRTLTTAQDVTVLWN